MANTGKAESIIQASGCGPFQIMIVFLVYCVVKMPAVFSMMFMSFGNYNPGWRCLDNVTVTVFENNQTGYFTDIGVQAFIGNINLTVSSNLTSNDGTNDVGRYGVTDTTVEYTQGTCPDFEACQHVEFDPETSTIVTEWGLLCSTNWISSVIISIQMAGLLVGSLVSGYFGDTIGRKKVMYMALALNGVLNVISAFLESWQSFAAVRFFFGIALSCIMGGYCVLPQEFLNSKWRGRMFPIPTWALGGITLAVTVMLCPDWRLLHVICAVLSFACCLTALWVPESLRWLEIKGREKEFDKVAKKITSMNKMNILTEMCDTKISFINGECESKPDPHENAEKATMLDLFRRGYRLSSLMIGMISFSATMIYYGIGFGVKSMSGNFFINLIINYAIEFPVSIFPFLLPNIIGRKRASILFMIITACLLVTTASFEIWSSGGTRRVVTMILALLAKSTVDASWYILMNQTTEIYPTSVRSIATGYASFSSKMGAILAPFLIPKDAETVYICYIVMAVLSIVCCFSVAQLPETKGRKLKETFNDE